MNTMIWLVVGGLVGWVASVILLTQEGILLNMLVGIVGGALGGWLLSPLVRASTINQGNFNAGLLVSLLGAVFLLAIVNLVRRGISL